MSEPSSVEKKCEHCWNKFSSHEKDANCCWCYCDQRYHPKEQREPMTADKIAHKIITDVKRVLCINADEKDLYFHVVTDIQQAIDEARAEGFKNGEQSCRLKSEDYAQGFSDARERAASMMEKVGWEVLAKELRALQPREK